MNWALTVKDVVLGNRLPFCIPFSKDGIAQHEGLPLEERPHKAMNGVDHLLLLFTKIVGFPLSSPLTLRRSARNRTSSKRWKGFENKSYTAAKPIRLKGNKKKELSLAKPRRSVRNRNLTQFFEP